MNLSGFFNSFIFWGAWVIIPFIMEIIPSVMSAIILIKKRIKIASSAPGCISGDIPDNSGLQLCGFPA